MNVFSEAVTMKSSYGEAGNGVLRRFLAMRKKECRVNKAELSRKNTQRHANLKFREKRGNDH
jgi:hypothetical protein